MKAKTNKRFQYPVRTAKPGKKVKPGLANQVARITEMEALFTKCEETVRQLRQAIENKADNKSDLNDLFDFKDHTSVPSFLNSPAQSFDLKDLTSALYTLEAYYTTIWLSDFEADEAGLLPPDLKRGVLSEDGIYNLLEEYKRMGEEMKEIMGKM